jgi:hypothetical protein
VIWLLSWTSRGLDLSAKICFLAGGGLSVTWCKDMVVNGWTSSNLESDFFRLTPNLDMVYRYPAPKKQYLQKCVNRTLVNLPDLENLKFLVFESWWNLFKNRKVWPFFTLHELMHRPRYVGPRFDLVIPLRIQRRQRLWTFAQIFAQPNSGFLKASSSIECDRETNFCGFNTTELV